VVAKNYNFLKSTSMPQKLMKKKVIRKKTVLVTVSHTDAVLHCWRVHCPSVPESIIFSAKNSLLRAQFGRFVIFYEDILNGYAV
jgi:hypothetical protein